MINTVNIQACYGMDSDRFNTPYNTSLAATHNNGKPKRAKLTS